MAESIYAWWGLTIWNQSVIVFIPGRHHKLVFQGGCRLLVYSTSITMYKVEFNWRRFAERENKCKLDSIWNPISISLTSQGCCPEYEESLHQMETFCSIIKTTKFGVKYREDRSFRTRWIRSRQRYNISWSVKFRDGKSFCARWITSSQGYYIPCSVQYRDSRSFRYTINKIKPRILYTLQC